MFDENQGYTINDLGRRLANIIKIGTISEIKLTSAKARVKIGDLKTNWLPWINANSGSNNSWNPPEVGEQVIVLSPSGELNQAVILPSLYKSNASGNLPNIQSITYKDGSKVTFNHDSGNLDLNIKGSATIKVTGNAQIEAENITLTGNTNLGGAGGQAIARVGDKINITSGSSAGQWPIISGSDKVKAL